MTFEQEFAKGIEFLAEFNPDFAMDSESIEKLALKFAETSSRASEELFFQNRQNICAKAKEAMWAFNKPLIPYQSLSNSHCFLDACLQSGMFDVAYMNLTIGDIELDGERIFNATKETIRSAVNDGVDTKEKEKFHVWLTLTDMTVIDLTLPQLLPAHGVFKTITESDNEPFIWRVERSKGITYHPVLVDDGFIYRGFIKDD